MAKKRSEYDYLYISARIHAMENRMLTRERMERMLDARTAEDAAKVLTECGYEDFPALTPAAIEHLLDQARLELFADLRKASPDPGIVDVFCIKYDYHNAKVLLKAQAVELGRAPLRSEVDETLRGTLVNRCGSWRNVLYQIGLEPVVHISPFSGAALDRSPGRTRPHSTALYDCYYRLLSPGPDTRRNLTLVEELARSLGRPPSGARFRRRCAASSRTPAAPGPTPSTSSACTPSPRAPAPQFKNRQSSII